MHNYNNTKSRISILARFRSILLSSLVGVLSLPVAQNVLAIECLGNFPMLSPGRVDELIADITIVRHLDPGGNCEEAAEAHVSRVYQGDLSSETIRLSRAGCGDFDLTPSPTRLPVGSRWIAGLTGPGEDDKYALAACSAMLPVVAGEVSGYISDYDCPDHARRYIEDWQLCEAEEQQMSLDEFETVQHHYYASARQSIYACLNNSVSRCPDTLPVFHGETGLLFIPYLALKKSGSFRWTPPVGEVSIRLELLEPSNGQLLFNVLGAKGFSYKSPWLPRAE